MYQINQLLSKFTVNAVFYISAAGTLGSLLFSSFVSAPCDLCWYQRIFMYPIAIITGVALVTKNKREVVKYILPLAGPGFLLAFYHYLLQMKVIRTDIVTCNSLVPCSAVDWSLAGFITIPFLSMLGFAAICLLVLLYYRSRAIAAEAKT